jgi:hypothetical protein
MRYPFRVVAFTLLRIGCVYLCLTGVLINF